MTTIQARLGAIRGVHERGALSFRGVPYAAPPSGEMRWRAAAPAAEWTGTLDASRPANRCPQVPYAPVLATFEVFGEESEDCLSLNVHTPAADDARRPVLVWIHGGAYIQGASNEYDGTTLARENDVVIVTINYRLGILGFLDLSEFGSEYTGSAARGFEDQITALRWVRDNIADYGGDPENVTIWGESAGGGSVLALFGAPSAAGLFHKAIAMSPGEAAGPPPDNAKLLSTKLGIERSALLERLGAMSAAELVKLQIESGFVSGAFVDGAIVTRGAPQAIREQAGVPLIAGCTRDEGTFLASLSDTFPGALEMLNGALAFQIGNGDPAAYLAWLDEHLAGASPLQRTERVWQDMFRSASLRAAEAASRSGVGGWIYNFEVPTDNPLGITHASDLAFTFNAFRDGTAMLTFHDGDDERNRELADRWSKTLCAFARTGDPNGAALGPWPRYEPETRQCLVLEHAPRIASDPDGPALRAAYGMEG